MQSNEFPNFYGTLGNPKWRPAAILNLRSKLFFVSEMESGDSKSSKKIFYISSYDMNKTDCAIFYIFQR